MADKLENLHSTCAELHLQTARALSFWFKRGFVEQGRVRAGPVRLQLIIIFMCSTFPRQQLLLLRGGICSCRIPSLQHRGDQVLSG